MSDIEIARVMSISKVRTRGGSWTAKGFKYYKGRSRYWKLYFIDSEGVFHTKRISWSQAFYYRLVKKLKLKK